MNGAHWPPAHSPAQSSVLSKALRLQGENAPNKAQKLMLRVPAFLAPTLKRTCGNLVRTRPLKIFIRWVCFISIRS